jgi:hypothetical protein
MEHALFVPEDPWALGEEVVRNPRSGAGLQWGLEGEKEEREGFKTASQCQVLPHRLGARHVPYLSAQSPAWVGCVPFHCAM